MNRSIFGILASLLLLAILIPTGAAFATHGHRHPCKECTSGPKCVNCPKCKSAQPAQPKGKCKKCKLDASEGEDKKTCFEVETEEICIPRFVFPWQNKKSSCGCSKKSCDGGCSSSCTSCTEPGGCSGGKSGKCDVNHNGACVRTVNRLKKSSYECPTCTYKWSVDDGEASCTSCTE